MHNRKKLLFWWREIQNVRLLFKKSTIRLNENSTIHRFCSGSRALLARANNGHNKIVPLYIKIMCLSSVCGARCCAACMLRVCVCAMVCCYYLVLSYVFYFIFTIAILFERSRASALTHMCYRSFVWHFSNVLLWYCYLCSF